ncbi:MAG TPA: DUF4199 domain-containing protein [Chitinophagales bacterium]|nr:DUF4199 domain-containing protein [Chitinophagales bacterium]
MRTPLVIKFAVLNSLLLLIWLSGEYMLGFQDKFITAFPVLNMASLIIPVVCVWLLLRQIKSENDGMLTYQRAFLSGLLFTIMSAVLVIPVRYIFSHYINPEYADNLLKSIIAVTGQQTGGKLQFSFSEGPFLLMEAIYTFSAGTFATLVFSFTMKTTKLTL